jgi:hypothetical protein
VWVGEAKGISVWVGSGLRAVRVMLNAVGSGGMTVRAFTGWAATGMQALKQNTTNQAPRQAWRTNANRIYSSPTGGAACP